VCSLQIDLKKITEEIYKEVEPAIKEDPKIKLIKAKELKKSYPQDWPAYNQA